MKSNGYINATKICKDGGKILGNWNENLFSKQLIKELSLTIGLPIVNLTILIKQGGNQQITGTYVHPKLIPHIASWISPKFALMVSDIINEYIIS